jgi:hypothetical protein
MIVDVHTHLGKREYCAEGWWKAWTRTVATLVGRPVEKIWDRLPDFWNSTAEVLLQEMNEAHIDKSVLIGTDWGLGRFGDGEASFEQQNRDYAELARKYPDRIISVCGIDPRRKGAAEFLERAVREWGMQGVKIHPVVGFYPNDSVVYPVYAKASELGIPVWIHTGPIICQQSKFAQPIYCDDVALDFPDVNFILCHGGLWSWWAEAVGIIAHKHNVYLDISAWQGYAHRRPVEFFRTLRSMIDLAGPYRILWGSDWPFLKTLVSQVKWVKLFQEPPSFVEEAGITFTEKEKKLMLGENFARLMNLKP